MIMALEANGPPLLIWLDLRNPIAENAHLGAPRSSPNYAIDDKPDHHATVIQHQSEALKEHTDRLTRSRAVRVALFEHDRVSLSVRSFTWGDFEVTQQSQMTFKTHVQD